MAIPYSSLTGLSATTPTLEPGYVEDNSSTDWDTFNGTFHFPTSAVTACKARMAPGQLVPGYASCYIRNVKFRDDSSVTYADVSGIGFIHATTTRVNYSASGGDSNITGYATNDAGQFSYYRSFGVNLKATEFRIITTTVPYGLIRTATTPPNIPTSMPSDPSWMSEAASAWYLDILDPVQCGTVYLTRIEYNYRATPA